MSNSNLTKSAADRSRLAELLRARTSEREPSPAPTVLSFAQERMWFFDQLVPNSPAYNIHAGLRWRGRLDADVLERSVAAIVRRHNVLRCVFPATNGKPSIALTDAPAAIRRVDISRSANVPEALDALTAEESRAPFDLATGPLLRVLVARTADDDHAVLITMHHIVSDGWSLGLIASELTRTYTALLHGSGVPGDVRLQYPAFAAAQRAAAGGAEMQRQMDFWRTTMAGAPATLDLPTDQPRPPAQSYRGGTVRGEIPAPLLSAARDLAKQESATLFMVLLTAFKVLLARWANQRDLVIGSPVAGRTGADAEAALGCFINTVVIRSELADASSFRSCLRQVRQASLAAFSNAEVPFDRLVEELQPQRDLSRNPLYQVMFNLLTLGNAPLQQPPGLQVDWLLTPDEPAKLDLTMYAIEDAGAVGLRMVYAADLFSAASMSELLSQYVLLLQHIVAAPDVSPFEHSLQTPQAATLLPNPAARLTAPEVPLVWQAFAARSIDEADRVALTLGPRQCSYEELHERVAMVARTLVRSGLRAQEVVALSGTAGIELIAAVLGILRARGVLLLLDPQLPLERRRLMMREGNVRHLVLVDRDADMSLADAAGIQSVIHAAGVAQVGALPDTSLPPTPDADDPAYLFFTSGTTGIPKAVLGTHKGLGHFVQWQRQAFGITPADRVAQLTGLSFDVILREFFLPLTTGATLCLRPFDDLSADAVLSWLAAEGITTIHTVPTLAQAWLTAAEGRVLPAITHTFFAGEPLPGAVVRRWRNLCPNGEVINLYGPTETTLAKCWYRVPAEVTDAIQPVGQAMPNAQALLLTPARRICGIGERGEIAIRTPFRTLGYRNAPAEQAKRFVRNPFTSRASDLVYLTGDEGRYRGDGILEIIGRVDDQVKLRGARIELGEIVAALCAHDDVAQAAVTVQGSGADAVLVAYIVPAKGGVDPEALRAFIRSRLPEYMVPSMFVPLAEMPTTANGKVDRRKLPVPDLASRLPAAPYMPPATPIEEEIAALWKELLKVERPGALDNFFDLGGHSLLATQLISRLRAAFDVDLPLRSIFDAPTIRGLSEAVTRAMAATDEELAAMLAGAVEENAR
jgi:amino acid adenylation domain-containing protein